MWSFWGEKDAEVEGNGWFVRGSAASDRSRKEKKEKKEKEGASSINSDDDSDEEELRRDEKTNTVWVTKDLMRDILAGLAEAGESPYSRVFHMKEKELFFGELPVRESTNPHGAGYHPNTFNHELFLEFIESSPIDGVLTNEQQNPEAVPESGIVALDTSAQKKSGAHM
jgi:hypothetical protein